MEEHVEYFPAPGQDCHRGSEPPQAGPHQGGGHRAGAAGQGFVFHPALVGADGEMVRSGEADEIDVGARGLKHGVEAEQPAPLGHRRRLQVVYRHHQVGHPHPHEMAGDVGLLQGDGLIEPEVLHPGQGQLDPAAPDLGVDDPGDGLKGQIFRGDP